MNSEFKFRGGKRTCSINWVSRDTTGFLVIFWKWGPKWYFTHFEGICNQNCKNFFFKSTNLQSLSVCWQCPNTIASNISRKHLNLADAVSFKLLIPQTLAKIWVSIMLLLFKLVVNESLLSHSYQCRNFKLRFLMVNCYWSIFFFFKSTNLQSLSVCWQCPNTIASNISRKHLNLADAVSFKLLIPQTLAKIWVSIMLLLFKLVVNESLLSHSYQCRNFKLRFLMVNCYWSIFPCNRYIKAPCSTWIMKFKSMGEIIEQFTRLDQTRPDQTTSPHPTPPLPAHKKR